MIERLRAYLFSDPWIILSTIGFGTISIVVSLVDPSGNKAIDVARVWAKLMLRVVGARVQVQGLEHLDPNQSYVIAANHLSYMDTPVILSTIPVRFRFLAKRGLFQIPFLGTHLKQAGHIPVPLEDARGSVKTLQQAAEAIKTKNISLLIFPEGGRSPDAKLAPFKDGAAYIAIRAGVPIIPMALSGTEHVLPFGSGTPRTGRVTLKILPPISITGRTMKNRQEITALVHQQISQALGIPALQPEQTKPISSSRT